MKKSLIGITALMLLIFSSCEKQESAGGKSSGVKNMDNLEVPVGFTWENSTDIFFDIAVSASRFGDSLQVVEIYDGDPLLGGRVLSKGSASVSNHFITKVYLPNTVKEVYIVKTAPDNSSTTEKVKISGKNIQLVMSAVAKDKVTGDKVHLLSDSPDCNSGCDVSVTSSNSNLTVERNDVMCVKGSNITISVTMRRGSTLRICGTNVTVQNLNMDDDTDIIVTSSGSATFSSLNLGNDSKSLTNYGTAIIGGASYSGNVINEGTMTVNGDFNLNPTSEFENYGTFTVNGSMEMNSSTIAINSGSLTVTSNFQLNSNRNFTNNCLLWVKGNYNNQGRMKNYSLIKVNLQTTVNGSTEISLYSGAMLQTASIIINGTIAGYTSSSLVKVAGNTIINSGGKVMNFIQYCDSNGIETNNGSFSGGATQACSLYIPVTSCNTSGNGTPPVVDTDGDGVNDPQDEYPNDATKAYNNYYPASTNATVAFEDKWPLKGDYDMNDVVISYRYKIVTNAANKVVQVNGDYKLRATGGDFKNGFGIEFPVTRTSVSGTTGGTLETGQTNAVVILFTDMRAAMAQWNTRDGYPVTPEKAYSISFNVSNGPSLSTFSLGPYNPFIWDNGNTNNGRGREIHLPGKTPTAKATTSLFGTGDDNSNISAARYYVTATGLPWAMAIPISTFDYPLEQTSIILGYLKFQAWAESGGSQYTDWYSNEASGYRDNSKLYQP